MNKNIFFWGLLIFVALLVRIFALIYWETKLPDGALFYFGDSDTYYRLANSITAQKNYQFEGWQIFRMPGYPLLLAPFCVMKSPENVLLFRLENVFFGTLLVLAVGFLAFQLFHDQKIAKIAACMVAVDPCLAITSVWVLSETTFTLVVVLQFSAFIATWRSQQKSSFFLFSTLFGLSHAAAVYLRPSWLYFAPVLIFLSFAFFWQKENFTGTMKKVLSFGLISCLIFSLLLFPWWVRNYRITGHIVLTTLQMGASLYDGLNPTATGGSDMEFVEKFRKKEHQFPSGNPNDIYEYRLDRRMKQESIDWASKNPGRVIELVTIKFFRLWNVWPNEPAFSNIITRIIVFLSFAPVLVLGLFGYWKCFRSSFEYTALLLPAVYTTMLHLIFVSSLRYRIPVMPFFMILAAYSLVLLWNSRKITKIVVSNSYTLNG